RVHGLVSLAAALLGNGGIVLLEQLVVLGHELFARIRVHFHAERFGQVAPNVFVELGELVGRPLTLAAHAALLRVVLLWLILFLLFAASLLLLLLPAADGSSTPLLHALSSGIRSLAAPLLLLVLLLILLLRLLLFLP